MGPWTFLAAAHISAAAGQTRRILSEKKQWTLLWCQEVVLSPGEEARVGTRQMLVRMVANNMMMGVWGQGGQLACMARPPASSLHWGLAAGRTESLVVADVKLAEVFGGG